MKKRSYITDREKLESILIPAFGVFSKKRLEENKEEIFEIIPELKDEENFNQNNEWHIYDVFGHTLKALEMTKPELDVRIAVLLHDIGKPHCYQDDGKVRHFKGHSKKSAEMSKEILERLGYEENKIKDIVYLIENHSTTIDINKVNRNNIKLTKKLLQVQFCDAIAYNPKYIKQVLNKLEAIGKQLIKKEKMYKDEEQR
ncbi:MAG: HD domain-containing protein [Clostridia bacterium]|nr:HD domain-containing protein [Clostridia bacterium]